MRRRPELDHARLDDVVSDCCLGLLAAIRDWPGDDVERFGSYALAVMKTQTRKSLRDWRFTKDQRRSARKNAMTAFRRSFVREHGRVPSADECNAHLQTILSNPAFQVGAAPTTFAQSDLDQGQDLSDVAARTPPVDARLLNRELLELALAAFDGADRRIVNMVLDGASLWEVAKEMNVGERAVSRKVNGLLWVAKCQVELARYLGVDPGEAGPMPEQLRRLTVRGVRAPQTCWECGDPIQQGQSGRDQRYCKHACKMRAWRKRTAERAQAACG